MSSESNYIMVGNENLHYLRWGTGKRLVLAFHGYGDDAAIFGPLQEFISNEFTLLSIDLPHHGNSKWAGDEMFTKNDLVVLVESLMSAYGVRKISLLGYSMGGRVCLALIELLPISLDKVVLLATDGLTVNLYYSFFTKNAVGRSVFKNMLEKLYIYGN